MRMCERNQVLQKLKIIFIHARHTTQEAVVYDENQIFITVLRFILKNGLSLANKKALVTKSLCKILSFILFQLCLNFFSTQKTQLGYCCDFTSFVFSYLKLLFNRYLCMGRSHRNK